MQQFATQFNIKVVNMSLGEATSSGGVNDNTSQSSDDISREIQILEEMGITVVAAAGNSYANNPTPGEGYPAVVSTISVASTWSDTGSGYDFNTYSYGASTDSFAAFEDSAAADRFSATSQRSTLANQVAAPGVDIYSDWNGSSTDNSGADLLHNTLSGTSMASPFVSGLVALIQQAAFTYGGRYITQPSTVLDIIKESSDPITDSNVADNGRVQISDGQLVSSQTFNLPETGDQFDRVDVYKAIQDVKARFSGATSTADTDDTTGSGTIVPPIDGTVTFSEQGVIGTDGLNQVGNNDVDLYTLTLESRGTLSLVLSQPGGGTAFTGAIRLFDSNKNEIGVIQGSYPTLTTSTVTPLDAGTYYVGISSSGNVSYNITDGSGTTGGSAGGDYILTVGLSNPDPNGVAQGAQDVDLSDPNAALPNTNNIVATEFAGILGSDPVSPGSSTRVAIPNGDVDMFRVTAPDKGVLTVETNTSNLGPGVLPADTYVRVFDSSLNQLGANDDISNFDTDSFVQVNVAIGQTYYIAVTNFTNANFDVSDPFNRVAGSTATPAGYDLFFSMNNGDQNGDAFVATGANIGATINDAIGSDGGVALNGANGGFKDIDWYFYTASSDGLLDLDATSGTSGFSPSISLWTLTGNQGISEIGSTSGSGQHLIDQVAAGQTVYVSVTGLGDVNFNWKSPASGSGGQTGAYSLTSALDPLSDLITLSDNSIDNGTPETIAAGQIISANLGQDNGLIVGTDDVDMYKFVPTASGTYDIRTDTSQEGSADTVLRLFDASGNQIATNDNASSATTSSFISASLVAGQTYYIGVSGAGSASTSYNPLTGAGAGAGSTGNYNLAIGPTSSAAILPLISVSNPAPVPQFPNSQVVFTFTLSALASQPVTVNYATADGTAIAGTDYTAASGTVTFPVGTTSEAIPVRLLVNANGSGDRTFFLNLSSPSANAAVGNSQAVGTIIAFKNVSFSSKAPLRYTDANGHVVTLRLIGPGTGTLATLGSDIEQVDISLLNATAQTSLIVSSLRTTDVDEIEVTGSLATLSAPLVDLAALTVSGTLGVMRTEAVGQVNISGDTGAATIIARDASNFQLNSQEPIASLIATTFAGSQGSSVLHAPSIHLLHVTGDFGADMTLTATNMDLQTIIVGGQINSQDWSFNGSIGTIVAGSISGTSITASRLNVLHVSGDLTNSTINITNNFPRPIGSLVIGRSVNNSIIRSDGSINLISVGTIADSSVLVGINSQTTTPLPTQSSDFDQDDKILTFVVRGLPNTAFAVSNINVAADQIGTIILRKVEADNSGTPFGIATTKLSLFEDIEAAGQSIIWTPRKSAAPATPGDFEVNLIATT